MDLATIIGLLGAMGLIVMTMLMSGDLAMFINVPSLVIVFGGSICAVMAKYGLGQFLGAGKVVGKSFVSKTADPLELIDQIVELADAARKGGLLALEGVDVGNDFLARGIQLLVDGHDPDVVQRLLSNDRNLAVERHNTASTIFSALAGMAPAMGMIGTLIGLVAMLANMDDPKSIGPAMAVALLTTLYGAVLANAFCEPVADKLKLRAAEEALTKSLVIDALLAIQAGQNPRVIDSMLRTYLPEGKREVASAG
ncbi:MAG: flagellar motor protein PomA [Gammaproteobacteria bacterium]|uniref:flagellar motor protein PomA n=1 Tax=Pseudomaricurvus alcaniphilus TaxID=1166482 RepID=UPI00140E9512|nr:flagellar motor protein PomA [Gammaproteobacteria bacterium]NHN37013.1 flagellar motor protein PomA [Pseudomaricurvus alcaniphilus]